ISVGDNQVRVTVIVEIPPRTTPPLGARWQDKLRTGCHFGKRADASVVIQAVLGATAASDEEIGQAVVVIIAPCAAANALWPLVSGHGVGEDAREGAVAVVVIQEVGGVIAD